MAFIYSNGKFVLKHGITFQLCHSRIVRRFLHMCLSRWFSQNLMNQRTSLADPPLANNSVFAYGSGVWGVRER